MDELERLREELTTVQLLDASLGFEALATAVVRRAAALSGADACLLLLQTGEEPAFLAATHGAASEPSAGFPSAGHPDEATVRHWLGAEAGASVAVLPFPSRTGVRGWLVLHTREPRPADTGVPDLLQSLVGQAAALLCVAYRLQRSEKALQAARESASRLGALLDAAPDPMVTVDETGRVVLVNAETERVFGYGRAELLDQPVEMLMPERYREAHVRQRAVYGAHPRTRRLGTDLSLAARRKDGSEFPVEISLSPLHTDEGLLISSSIRDISDRQRVMAALQESEERFRTSFENSPIPKVLVDLEGRILRVNGALCNYLGYAEEELLSAHFQHLGHPDDLAADEAGLQQLLSGAARSFQMEKRYRPKVGPLLWGELSVSLVRDHEGRPLYFIRQIQDITDRKQAEAEQRRHAEVLRRHAQLLDLAQDAIIVRDLENRIVFWNRGAELTYGYSREEALGHVLWEMLQTRNVVAEPYPPGETMHSLLLKHGAWDGELLHTRKDGQVINVDVRQIVQRDERGAPLAILAINRDITPQKQAMAALQESEARAAAEALAMKRLHDLATRLLSCTELSEALEETLGAAMELLRADMGDVQLVNPRTGMLQIEACRGYDPDSLGHFPAIRVDDAAEYVQALRNGERVFIENVRQGAGTVPHPFLTDAAGFQAFLATPLMGRDNQLLGVLSTRWRAVHRPTDRELRVLDLYARQAAEFIQWMQLLQRERQNAAQLHAVLETLPVGVWLADQNGQLLLANPAGKRIWGDDELVAREKYGRYQGRYTETGKQIEAHEWGMARAVERGEISLNEEIEIEALDGARKTVLHSAVPIRSEEGEIRGGLVVIEDITELRKAVADRAKLLEATIREAHHRIKNNLQAVIDLLSLELASSDAAGVSEALSDSVERVQAIALVHDLLSRDGDLERVSIRQLAERLVPAVIQANTRGARRLTPHLQIADASLPSKQATAFALILNELITNAVKHAFSGRTDGRLDVRLVASEDLYQLSVHDDGPGLPDDFDFDTHANVGMQVVRTLVEGSLSGRLSLRRGEGMQVEITFPVTALEKDLRAHAASA